MRCDGDSLLLHLGRARKEVLLCAPFIKAAVMQALLARVRPGVDVTVITRWRPEEIASGISDIEVYDVVKSRPGACLKLLDRLHAKLYVSDGVCLAGSANLTAKALGWSPAPNLEILMQVDPSDEAITDLLSHVATAQEATFEERRAMADSVAALPRPDRRDAVDAPSSNELAGAGSLDNEMGPGGPWLPTCAAPRSLYAVYRGTGGDRLTQAVVSAGQVDLRALGVSPGLGQADFEAAVARALGRMPAVRIFLEAAARDLPDDEGVRLIEDLRPSGGLAPDVQWRVLWEWLTLFFRNQFELAPTRFVLRRKP